MSGSDSFRWQTAAYRPVVSAVLERHRATRRVERRAAWTSGDVMARIGAELSVCGSCGYLQAGPVRDPMRTDPTVAMPACPACGDHSWIDPLVHGNRDALLDRDAHDGRALTPAQRFGARAFAVARLAFALPMLVLIAVPFVMDHSTPFVSRVTWLVYTLPLSTLAIAFTVGAVRRLRQVAIPDRPARWRLALGTDASAIESHTRIDDAIAPIGDLVHAPLSGRPCVAYEIAARRDDDPDAPAGTWILLEQANAPCRIGSQSIARDALSLDIRGRQPSDAPRAVIDDHLTRRGLLAADAAHVYETIVSPGERVTLRSQRGAPSLRLRRRQNDRARAPRRIAR